MHAISATADFLQPPAVPSSPAGPVHAQTADLGREFESLFVSLLLKEMRQSLTGEGLFPGDSGDALGGLFDLHLSRHLCAHGGIGLAHTILSSLSAHEAARPAPRYDDPR